MVDGEPVLQRRFALLENHLDKRLRRLVAAAEAEALGARGFSLVSRCMGVSRRAIRMGMQELHQAAQPSSSGQRIRRAGGGRKKAMAKGMAILAPSGIPASPINTVDRALADASLAARKMVVNLEHTLGGSLKSLGNPVHMSEMKEQHCLSPPLLGEHTDEVLREVAAYGDEHIARLVEQAVVYSTQRFER